MEVLVVGAGAMGRWVGRTLAPTFDVAFADRDPTVARAAADAVDGRAVALDVAASFELVCLAVPIGAVSAAVATHADRAERAMIDVTGVMADPVAAMRDRLPDRERVSFHPLFAPENAPGNVAVVPDAQGPVTDEALAAIDAAGNHVFETDPGEHDAAMETVQAGAHAAVLAYALAATDVRPEFATPVSRRLDELVEGVTGGTPRVYREIQETFPGAEAVAEAARRIADADGEAFDRLYAAAGADANAGAGAGAGDAHGARNPTDGATPETTPPDAGGDPE